MREQQVAPFVSCCASRSVPLSRVLELNDLSSSNNWNVCVTFPRREAAQAKKEAESQGDVVQALRRDLAGAAARMSDMAGELSDKQKQKLEQYEERIRDQDSELEGQRKQLMQLSALVDEQQKEINSREDKLSEQQKVSVLKTQQNITLLCFSSPSMFAYVFLCNNG